ncbi:MAG: ATP-binding cassette domain-containing protein, partial [Pseudomonadota bacterium]
MAACVIQVSSCCFRYFETGPWVLNNLVLEIEKGERCLLIGANGVGKTTLLRVLAGRHMILANQVVILGRPAFHDTSLADRVTFLGGSFPLDVDICVEDVVAGIRNVDQARAKQVYEILAIDPTWRMHRVSDGQRRRVQLLLGLLKQTEILLLDEITTDLDLVARADLLAFLREESEQKGVTILYATHVLDSLEQWATHLAFMRQGQITH